MEIVVKPIFLLNLGGDENKESVLIRCAEHSKNIFFHYKNSVFEWPFLFTNCYEGKNGYSVDFTLNRSNFVGVSLDIFVCIGFINNK